MSSNARRRPSFPVLARPLDAEPPPAADGSTGLGEADLCLEGMSSVRPFNAAAGRRFRTAACKPLRPR